MKKIVVGRANGKGQKCLEALVKCEILKRDRQMTMQELSDEMRKERARCSTHCGTWNNEDKDCKIYGELHCPPSKCRYFLATELAKRNKEIEK